MGTLTKRSYAELFCRTNYSFLRGASHPSELVEQAASLGLHSLAITDLNGVYGLPKAHLAAQKFPKLKLIVGAEVSSEVPLIFWAQNRKGYGLLCRLLTEAHSGKEKGLAFLSKNEILDFFNKKGSDGLLCAPSLFSREISLWKKNLDYDFNELKVYFPNRIFLPLGQFFDGLDEKRKSYVERLSQTMEVPIFATNDVHFHQRSRKNLHDVVTSIREGVTLKSAGRNFFRTEKDT